MKNCQEERKKIHHWRWARSRADENENSFVTRRDQHEELFPSFQMISIMVSVWESPGGPAEWAVWKLPLLLLLNLSLSQWFLGVQETKTCTSTFRPQCYVWLYPQFLSGNGPK